MINFFQNLSDVAATLEDSSSIHDNSGTLSPLGIGMMLAIGCGVTCFAVCVGAVCYKLFRDLGCCEDQSTYRPIP